MKKTLLSTLGIITLSLAGCAIHQKQHADYNFFNGDVQIDRKTTYNQTPTCAENVAQTELHLHISDKGDYRFQLFTEDNNTPTKQWQTQISKEQIPYQEKVIIQGTLDRIEIKRDDKTKVRNITYGHEEIKVR